VGPLGSTALTYRQRGWSVVPVHTAARSRCSCGRADCPSAGKHPRVPWAEFQRAAPPVPLVEGWWRRWPASNVGVVTGGVSGVVVLDVDPRNGGDASLAEMERRFGALPCTPEVRTGGGGRHLWFRAPEQAVPSRAVLPGLDVKGEGGVVIVPPSVHPSGARYAWVPGRDPETVPLGAAPAWFVDAPASGPDARPGGDTVGAVVRTPVERATFAALWAHAGVVIAPGDHQYLCPFHPDHHPSLHVDADGCRWYCFGCRRGGGSERLRELLGVTDGPRPRGRVSTAPGLDPPTGVTLSGDEVVEVVGESRHQDALLELTGGQRHYGGADVWTAARLVPDPGNPVDPSAVAVVIKGRRVGWLGRNDAARYLDLVEAVRTREGEATCVARIRGGWDRGGSDVGRFGVVLALPPALGASG
jgi:hypothetical protein